MLWNNSAGSVRLSGYRVKTLALILGVSASVAGCGGGQGSGVGRHAPTYGVSGSIVGLTEGALTLRNGLDQIEVKAEAASTFQLSDLPAGVAYDVHIMNDTLADFALQCDVVNGTATMPAHQVKDLLVRCARVQSVRLLAGAVMPTLGRDGLGQSAQFVSPGGMAMDGAGRVYVADTYNHTIRRIEPDGRVSTVAGSGGQYGATDGTGAEARFFNPAGVAIDVAGNLLVADAGNHIIRKITSGGVVTTLAGQKGQPGSADGKGSAARFNSPKGIAIDTRTGDVLVADTGNHTIRRITSGSDVTRVAGQAEKSGSSDDNTSKGTVALFGSPEGLAVDVAGNVYVADTGNHTIRKIDKASGLVTTYAGKAGADGEVNGDLLKDARFRAPSGLAVDGSGNLIVADTNNHALRWIGTNGQVTTLMGTPGEPGAQDSVDKDNRPQQVQFAYPKGIAVYNGSFYVGDTGNGTIRLVKSTSTPTTYTTSTFAGKSEQFGFTDNAKGSNARFDYPDGIVVSKDGTLFVTDSNNGTIRKITPTGEVTTLAGHAEELSGHADGAGAAARFNFPTGIAIDNQGMLFVADTNNNVIRQITPQGVVTTLAGDEAGLSAGSIDGVGPAARFNAPHGLAVSADDQYLFVADTDNHVIRRITISSRKVETIAGIAGEPLPEDASPDNSDVPIATAKFTFPQSITLDNDGNVLVADTGNLTIRRIAMSKGVVSTIAGSAGFAGHVDETGPDVRFANPVAIARDTAGNIYVMDDSTIRALQGAPSDSAYHVQTVFGSSTDASQPPQVTLGPLPRHIGTPFGLALTPKRIYFTSGHAVLFIDR
jgi:sugar lactone lactonase YvrE